MLRDDAAIQSSSALGGSEGAWVKYWDEASTIAVLEFEVAEAPQIQPAAPSKDKEKKKKPKGTIQDDDVLLHLLIVYEGDMGLTAPPAASALPVSDKPVTLNFSRGPTALKTFNIVPGSLSVVCIININVINFCQT